MLRIDYGTGQGEVIHSKGEDLWQVGEKFPVKGFFDAHREEIDWIDCGPAEEIIENKELLDQKLSGSRNGSFSVCCKVSGRGPGKNDFDVVSVLFFKVKMQGGEEEYLCCMKKA